MRLASRVALALGGAAFLASFAAPATARAMGAVVSSPPGASSAVALRFAVATSEETGAPSARWASVTVQGSATAFAWIVPVRPGALLELSPDTWLEALEASTAPRVVPPNTTPPCGFSGGAEVEGSFTPTLTTAPGAVVVATDRPTLDETLASWGLSLTPELSPAIDEVIASGSDLVAMLFTDASGTVVTRTLRVVDDEPAGVPLSLLTGGANGVQVTAFALSGSSSAFGAQPDLTVDPTTILWQSDGTSTYAAARDAILEANPGRWLLETGGASLVSTPTTLQDGATVPSLTSAYAALVSKAGDAGISDDLAVALGSGDAGAGVEWLARGRTVIAAGSLGQDAPLTTGAFETIGPVVTAAGYAQTCEVPAPPPQQQGTGGGSSGASPPSEGTSSGAAVHAGVGAATVAADSTDGCGGDSSDSSDGCGGDSSSSSEGSDSSSSDSSDGCGGSGTDSSSDSGSGCSGSSDSSSGDCSVQDGAGRGRPRRSATSRFLVFLVGIAALWRRRRSI
ncbi:MAG TPA: DUF2330 domain-containing protein [Polyangiaceae bacterium]|nr:DUF2330 domain-containing protein [Polyangiaceae bacterium]